MCANGLKNRTAKNNNQDPFLVLLANRNTPFRHWIFASSYNMRTHVPSLHSNLSPKEIGPHWIKTKAKKCGISYKSLYDNRSHNPPPLSKGEYARFQLSYKSWKPATVISMAYDRSNSGGIYRRDNRYINCNGESKIPEPEEFILPSNDVSSDVKSNVCIPQTGDPIVKAIESPTKVITPPANPPTVTTALHYPFW